MRIAATFRLDYPGFTLDVDLDLPGRGVTAVFGQSGCGGANQSGNKVSTPSGESHHFFHKLRGLTPFSAQQRFTAG